MITWYRRRRHRSRSEWEKVPTKSVPGLEFVSVNSFSRGKFKYRRVDEEELVTAMKRVTASKRS
jgi:hypothetical protein